MTNVYILQNDGNKEHSHTFTLSTDTDIETGQINYQGAYASVASGVFSVNSTSKGLYHGSTLGLSAVDFYMEHSHSVTGTINESGIEETRPINITYTIWRRTA
jgi:hypothetical protein